MKNFKIHKYKGQTIWFMQYRASDDQSWNQGIEDYEDCFLGTESEFEEWLYWEQWGQGYYLTTKRKKRHITEEEFEEWSSVIRQTI